MATHYVYEDDLNSSMLSQGDVLQRTPELVKQIREFFPYYADHQDYKYFMVITQGCDLFRRDGKSCNAQYLTLAAVRPLNDALRIEAAADQFDWQRETNVIGSRLNNKLTMFLESLIDNNKPGYFYLHTDLGLGIHAPCCAFLPLTVSLRVVHYDLLLRAKIAQLKETFQAKLGWLLGHMYSRVGTTEWNNHNTPKVNEQAKQFIEDTFAIIDDKQINEGIADLQAKGPLPSSSEIKDYIISKKVIPRKEKFNARALEVLTNTVKPINAIKKAALRQIRQDDALRSSVNGLLAKLEIAEEESGALADALIAEFIARLDKILSDENLGNKADILKSILSALLQDTKITQILK